MPTNKTKKVHVFYYAVLREQSGLTHERITTKAKTAGELYAYVQDRHGFTLGPDILKIAVNDSFKSWKTILENGDSVTFIPPLAGG
ncbi:MAG TPA: MoaD/ThiS family protein [Candidatus Omnitrophota bacterium]|nr:MoaD/ThiS family protein [Candidatus Omnitrophota bacterium]HPD85367.1 MoaD/ThiS family protein [Candidatus Omnitrophota bacterium]HRZ04132.1 MoaD/ThiS family protein [Candidatus Omnitrophota bacterium]